MNQKNSIRTVIATLILGLFTVGTTYAIVGDVADDLVDAGKDTVSAVQKLNKAVTDPFAGEFSNVDSQSEEHTLIHPAVDVAQEKTKTDPDAFTASNYTYDGNLLHYTKENLMHAMVMTERDLLHGKATFRPNYMISLNWNAHTHGAIVSAEIHAWNTNVDLSEDKLASADERLYVYNQENSYILSPYGSNINNCCIDKNGKKIEDCTLAENACGHYILTDEECIKNLYIWLELKTADGHVILSNILRF